MPHTDKSYERRPARTARTIKFLIALIVLQAILAVGAWTLLGPQSAERADVAPDRETVLIPDDLPPAPPATDIARLWSPAATRDEILAIAGDGLVLEDPHRIVFDGALGRWPARFIAGAVAAPVAGGSEESFLFHSALLVNDELRKPFFCPLLFEESVEVVAAALGPAADTFVERDWNRFIGGAHWRTAGRLVIAGGRLEFEEEIDDAARCEVVVTLGPIDAAAAEVRQ